MGRAVLQACLPWLALLAAALGCAYLLVRANRSRVQWRRLRRLHHDQGGGVQTLSFVLTLPFFVMIMMFIVQVSQLMIGVIVVHYAAFAAARSAIVWIPAGLDQYEAPNSISSYFEDPQAEDQVFPVLDPEHEDYGPGRGGVKYRIAPGSPKYDKIASAAVMACMAISPSRDLGLRPAGNRPFGGGLSQATTDGGVTADIIWAAYAAMDPDSRSNLRIPARLENKLAYALENTEVQIRFYHKNTEPPLVTYYHLADPDELFRTQPEFQFNELGWQDQITVTVKHDLALLPGPGRLLARWVVGPDGSPDKVAETIRHNDRVYVYPLKASATLGNEGQKSVRPYVYQLY